MVFKVWIALYMHYISIKETVQELNMAESWEKARKLLNQCQEKMRMIL